MNEITVSSWAEFVSQIEKLQEKWREAKAETRCAVYPLLFRGQPDSTLPLQTTLERETGRPFSMLSYFIFVSQFACKIETVTGVSWSLPDLYEYRDKLKAQPLFAGFPCPEYYAYLRHHGFPSPLLDWSRSPYVALLFAFMRRSIDEKGHVSVFTYFESRDGNKDENRDKPRIHTVGPYFRAHMRHHLQQSDYTVCTSGEALDVCFASHEEVFKRADPDQDLLWKLNIPKSQRVTFLEHLYQMNVTPYSLFQTEDKLMEDLWLSEGVLRQKFM